MLISFYVTAARFQLCNPVEYSSIGSLGQLDHKYERRGEREREGEPRVLQR